MKRCAVPECDRPHKAKGFCNLHYLRWRTHGDPTVCLREFDGRTVDRRGYVLIRVDGQHVFEHRLVMERLLGRRLLPTEHVHHRNRDRADNRPENLELQTASEHSLLHGAGGARRLPVNRSDTHRWCPGCQAALPIANFWRDGSRSTGTQPACRTCMNARRKAWRHRVGISKSYAKRRAG